MEKNNIQSQYKAGECIFGIEGSENVGYEVLGYLFVAQCGEYIICVSTFVHLEGRFWDQMEEIYQDCMEGRYSDFFTLLHNSRTFRDHDTAVEKLKQMKEQDSKNG